MSAALLAALGGRSDAFVRLDFESYYDAQYSLKNKKMTTESYVRDPRFETIGVGVKVGSAPSVWMEDADFRRWAAGVDWSRVTLMAHHAQFDGLVLSHHYAIRPRFWICTLSMGRALHGSEVGGSLAALAEHYGVGQKGHEVDDAKGKRRRDFTPEEWLRYGAYCNNDVELMDRLFQAMRPRLPVTELWLIDMTVRMFTEPVLDTDQAVLAKAIAQEKAKKRTVLLRVAQTAGAAVPAHAGEAEVLEAARAVLSSNDKFAELLRAMGEEIPMKQGKNGPIPAFAQTDPYMQSLLDHPDEDIRAAAEARLAVKSTIIETRSERFAEIGQRGAFPVYLKYSGAHTHRWSGGDSQNAQNLNRGGALRAALVAPKGHTLVVVDSGQIEARKTAWVAGEAGVLDTFRRLDALGYDEKGEPLGDFYSERGSVYFGKKLSKKTTPVERQTAKSMELGLGFGQGYYSFSANLLRGFMGAPPVQFGAHEVALFGVDVARFANEPLWPAGPSYPAGPKGSEEVRRMLADGVRLPKPSTDVYADLLLHCAVTHHLVRLYRTSNSRVARLWKTCDKLIATMAPEEGSPDEVRMRFGPIEVMRHALRKPNGLSLRYPKLHRSKGGGHSYWGFKEGRPQWLSVYGGLLTENIVQSLARDVVAEQALWIRAKGYRVVTTTHDEVVCMVREEQAEECLAYMLERLKTPPSWCRDLPLNATGSFARSYGDCK